MATTFERCYRIVAFEWMLEGCTYQDWLWYHQFWNPKVHFTAWIWVMNIIDNAKSFLYISWFDRLRGIHREEHWAYNDEPFFAKYEMHVGMTWQFYKGGWPYILGGYVNWRQVYNWSIILMGVGMMHTFNQRIILGRIQEISSSMESSYITLGGIVMLDKQWK